MGNARGLCTIAEAAQVFSDEATQIDAAEATAAWRGSGSSDKGGSSSAGAANVATATSNGEAGEAAGPREGRVESPGEMNGAGQRRRSKQDGGGSSARTAAERAAILIAAGCKAGEAGAHPMQKTNGAVLEGLAWSLAGRGGTEGASPWELSSMRAGCVIAAGVLRSYLNSLPFYQTTSTGAREKRTARGAVLARFPLPRTKRFAVDEHLQRDRGNGSSIVRRLPGGHQDSVLSDSEGHLAELRVDTAPFSMYCFVAPYTSPPPGSLPPPLLRAWLHGSRRFDLYLDFDISTTVNVSRVETGRRLRKNLMEGERAASDDPRVVRRWRDIWNYRSMQLDKLVCVARYLPNDPSYLFEYTSCPRQLAIIRNSSTDRRTDRPSRSSQSVRDMS